MIGAHELSIKADLSYRQVDFWTRAGLLTALDNVPGSGVPREYPDDQLALAQAMSRLVKVGILPRLARRLAGELLERGWAQLGEEFVVAGAPSRCRVCGCDDEEGCWPGGCSWVERDLCSACVTESAVGSS